MILVTGATGNIGRNVVTSLLRRGEPVRALTLDTPEKAALPGGVEVVSGDMADPQVLATALRGVRQVFLFPVFEIFGQVLSACVAAQVDQVVLLSSAVVTFTEPGWLGREQARLETEVRESGLGWAFVRPTYLMANDLNWAPQLATAGVAAGAYGGAALAPVDERDVAAVAAHLLKHGLTGCTFEVTGPQALTQIERVRIIGEVTGRPARFHETPAGQAAREIRRWVPEPAVDQLLDILRSAQERPHRVLDTVRTLTGDRPRTYAEWVEHHRADFLAPV
ncbi:SDR family oxidoreductase [Nonomuraea diastatica]|uniref:NAD-dependent epimerase/dehydratase family protein n=1 Tax=Nonomuraea diastatica TaxID=1848329 RepID=A0A4R4VYB0_9ACTN|nr:NAD(P)H-binding protein [Nonomuraea diastatica]TDD11118.1 NAD-dependent epimerase/dehydratase family protein [Nonomuraea diastatica]